MTNAAPRERLAANLSLLFTELPFAGRFEAAAQAGFRAVEFGFTDAMPPGDVRRALQAHGLVQVLATLPGPPGDKGVAAQAGQEALFGERLRAGLAAAALADCRLLHLTTGLVADSDMAVAAITFRHNLDLALREAERHDITLVIEAINRHDLPGYFIRSLADAIGWIDRIGHPRLRLLVDFYHADREGCSLRQVLAAVRSHGAHVQIAGSPGRQEPDTGTLDFADVFSALDAQHYPGWIGCEYRPRGTTLEGLSWMDALQEKTPAAETTRR